MFDRKLVGFNDKLYEIIKVFKDKENFPVEEFKEFYDCEICLRKDNLLYFCQQLQEIQVIEHTDNGKVQLVEEKQKESTPPEEGRTES